MANINNGDEKLVFESSEAVKVISTFDELGLKEDLLRGIYAYSMSKNDCLNYDPYIYLFSQTSKSRRQSSSAPSSPSPKVAT